MSAPSGSERILYATVRLAGTLGVLATALLSFAPACTLAAPKVTLHASFTPERLGHSTTMHLRIQVAPGEEPIPPPLVQVELRYPAGLDVQLSGLGIDACTSATLETAGIDACPVNSIMGEGQAVAEFLIAHRIVRELAAITAVRTTEQEGHLTMLLYVYDETAVSAQLILTTQLLPAGAPFAGRVNIKVPLVQGVPETPDMSVAEIQLGLGPETLTYSEVLNGKIVHYIPQGISLPKHCPRRGFPFAVTLGFANGTHATATRKVPCPSHRGR